jgi:methionyl-tRNA synthetase
MADTFFITTAIDYTNGAPHIGHAYEKVLADVLARYHRLKGDEVFFLTGVDQHGQKVQQSAEKQGIAPQEFVDGITAKFIALWDKLNVRYDGWAATTDPKHKDCVRAILQRLWDDKGDDGQSKWIYKKSEGGYYSVRQEQFLTDKERGADGEFGPEWQPVEFREEENFYFRLKDHRDWLLGFVKQQTAEDMGERFIIPNSRRTELENAVYKIDGDLCISRPESRLKWGIPFPEGWGAGFVTYVWFDALVNYISFVGYDPSLDWTEQSGEFRKWWPALHVIGKDILIPAHGIYWPVMLRSLGCPDSDIPQLLVHGWWNISGAKMSKSLGNVIDPDLLADKYGAEAVRYYLVSDITTGQDADFSEERLIQRYNTDLANSLGNLLNRSLNMAAKYREGKLTRDSDMDHELTLKGFRGEEIETEERLRAGQELMDKIGSFVWANLEIDAVCFDVSTSVERYLVSEALQRVLFYCSQKNSYIEQVAPWKLAKQEKEGSLHTSILDAVLYHLAESLRIIAILLSPALPKAAQGIFDQLNWKMDEQGQETRFRLADAQWGGLPDGHQLGQPTPLFPRIETPKS